MKTFILLGISASQRQLLAEAGVMFYDWGNDVMVEEPQLEAALSFLNATGTEVPSDRPELVNIQLTYGRTEVSNQPVVLIKRAAPKDLDPEYASSRANYVQTCAIRLDGARKDLMGRVAGLRAGLPQLQQRYLQSSRQQFLHQEFDVHASGKFADNYRNLCQHPKVEGVRVINGSILVYTTMIHVTDPETRQQHELGQFLITIATGTATAEPIRWFNRTRQVEAHCQGMQAPTVFGDGTPVTTEIKETLVELVASFEFAVAADLAIQFVENVGNSAMARFVNRWPKIAA